MGLAAVIFDVDGTLVDSERDGHRVAFNHAFAAFGLEDRWDEPAYGRLLAVAGGRMRLRHYFLASGMPESHADDLAVALHKVKTRLFRDLIEDGAVPTRPGVRRLIDELDDAGVHIAVATTGSRAWVLPLLEQHFGTARFAAIVTGDDVQNLKPDPEAFHLAVAALGVPPADVVVLEDSENGVAAAVAAGLVCVAVTNDYTRGDHVDRAALVTDGFGDPGIAQVRNGDASLLVDGAIRVHTLRALVA